MTMRRLNNVERDEEVKQKQDEPDKVLDQLEDMDKWRDTLTTETEIMTSEHEMQIVIDRTKMDYIFMGDWIE